MGKGNPKPIKSWKKGESGNPKGAPKKENSITNMLRNISEKDKKEIAEKIVEMCKNGDQRFVQMFLERTDGKVKDEVKLDSDINIIFTNKTKEE